MENQINLTEIRELIPHREPFLYIDKLANIEKLSKATGIKKFTIKDNFFNEFSRASSCSWSYNSR